MDRERERRTQRRRRKGCHGGEKTAQEGENTVGDAVSEGGESSRHHRRRWQNPRRRNRLRRCRRGRPLEMGSREIRDSSRRGRRERKWWRVEIGESEPESELVKRKA
uniref:Uncharacterized protein n=1 Tax=Opuntia streptacantha TaxID=393608 RepID=A0A7C9DTE9_OPUST